LLVIVFLFMLPLYKRQWQELHCLLSSSLCC
jgi:hypothetical protein